MDYGAGKECVLVIHVVFECWDLPGGWWLCFDCLVLGIR